MTAGSGIVHCEMFPLLKRDEKNRGELFQIWINLPRADKMVPADFKMLWHEEIPKGVVKDEDGKETQVVVIANGLRKEAPWGGEINVPTPPSNSWASKPQAHVWIWTLKMQPGAKIKLPASEAGLNRNIYFFLGGDITVSSGADPVTAVDSRKFPSGTNVKLKPDADAWIQNGDKESEILFLQGKPIDEPVVQYGPFVMSTQEEIRQTFMDYQRTQVCLYLFRFFVVVIY